jgi:hypothetical protein
MDSIIVCIESALGAGPGSDTPTSVVCKPAGKRRYAAWVDDQFLGHAIARVDGTWAVKARDEQTYPGFHDRAAALRGLLELRVRV